MRQWHCKPFDALTLSELYDILALRQAVFVVEQYCPYLDADGKDAQGLHLFATTADGRIDAYARLLPVGVSYPHAASIGRILTHPKARGTGAGGALLPRALAGVRAHYGAVQVQIGAQCYLEPFYGKYGFKPCSGVYLEDGIPHLEMILQL